jgi:hypothetical protein
MTTDSIMLPWPRYQVALARLRRLIAEGLPLVYEDSTTLGDKYTHCSWGLCSRDVAAWIDAEDHLWPDQFRANGRVAPKYRAGNQRCPWDQRNDLCDANEMLRGCFYYCRIFQQQPAPTVEEALCRYDQAMVDAGIVQER